MGSAVQQKYPSGLLNQYHMYSTMIELQSARFEMARDRARPRLIFGKGCEFMCTKASGSVCRMDGALAGWPGKRRALQLPDRCPTPDAPAPVSWTNRSAAGEKTLAKRSRILGRFEGQRRRVK